MRYCLTIQTIILALYTLYIIINLFLVFGHILSFELTSLFSEHYAHAGADSEFILNNNPGLNVSLDTANDSDGNHHHQSCTCPHENTVDIEESESQNNNCCLCGNGSPDAACVTCDCEMHDSCLAETTYDSVLPDNENNGNNGNNGNNENNGNNN